MVDDGSVSDESSKRDLGAGGDHHSSDGNSTSGRSNDESSTTGTSVTGSTRGGGRDIPDDIIAREESRAVALSRIMVLVVLVVSATAAGVATFVLSKKAEMADFEVQFNDFAYEIADVSHVNAANVYGLMDSFSSTITSFALSSGSEWPYVTVPHFEVRGQKFFNVSSAQLLSFAPVVYDVEAWNDYSVQNQDWIQESYNLRGDDTIPDPIPTEVYRFDEERNAVPVNDHAEYAPLWQEASAPYHTDTINADLYSHEIFHKVFDFARQTNSAILSEVFDPSTLLGEEALFQIGDGKVHPESILVQNIYDSFDASTRTVVGALIAVIPWDLYFEGLLHEGANGLVCVLRDTCGDEFTYRLDGPQATFLGQGDLHDRRYDELEFYTEFAPFVDFSDAADDSVASHCEYSLHVFPSVELEEAYHSKKPFLFTVAVVMVFFFTSLIFMVYDFLVQRRQEKVQSAAVKSNAIVSSLFPAEIRDRLFQHNEEPEQNPKNSSKYKSKNMFDSAPKFRLKNYLDDGEEDANPNDGGAGADGKAAASPEMFDTKPIADLFPNTTVMFADIAGFTAWSSVREPSQVFTLLETVYHAFDIIAKKRHVFKVETVGDCYVAVTGLPEPRKDHAVIMGRFARDCMERMKQLSSQLEVTLGPDTGDLAMRFGLHSGPVTAGVLRGDKSRFQLFGDTVNTAARIESTGQRNRIHISQETATLLEEAGKGHWLQARDDLVVAKGKGEMKTYWVVPKDGATYSEKGGKSSAERASKDSSKKSADDSKATPPVGGIPDPTVVSSKVMRLVDWNVDVLQRLLKLIIAKRSAKAHPKTNESTISSMERRFGRNGMVLDEVTEIVTLPKFDAEVARNQMDPSKVQVPPAVVAQLREYVKSIACTYRDNPFHNFEHASHVTMSVSKLLSRIVAPDIDGTDGDLNHTLHDHTYGITSDPLTQFAVVLSALIHDADHVGIPNFLLVNENQGLASKYRNKSVAEQNSVDIAWKVLMEPRFSALRSAIYDEESELKRFRQLLVNTVLATDIFDKELSALRKNRWEKAFSHEDVSDEDVNRKATIVIEHLIQASDVAHTMQHWHIYQKWNERLFSEMLSAHRAGRSSKDPSSGWYQGELGFFDNYIIPLAKKLKECGVFGVSSDEYLNYALENRREWASKGEDVVKRMVAKHAVVEATADAPTEPSSSSNESDVRSN